MKAKFKLNFQTAGRILAKQQPLKPTQITELNAMVSEGQIQACAEVHPPEEHKGTLK